jgi:hypothetical protein
MRLELTPDRADSEVEIAGGKPLIVGRLGLQHPTPVCGRGREPNMSRPLI